MEGLRDNALELGPDERRELAILTRDELHGEHGQEAREVLLKTGVDALRPRDFDAVRAALGAPFDESALQILRTASAERARTIEFLVDRAQNHVNDWPRTWALENLTEFQPLPPAALGVLVDALLGDDDDRREAASEGLEKLDEGTPTLIHTIRQTAGRSGVSLYPLRRWRAWNALAALSSGHESASVREEALGFLLNGCHRNEASAVPAAVEALRTADVEQAVRLVQGIASNVPVAKRYLDSIWASARNLHVSPSAAEKLADAITAIEAPSSPTVRPRLVDPGRRSLPNGYTLSFRIKSSNDGGYALRSDLLELHHTRGFLTLRPSPTDERAEELERKVRVYGDERIHVAIVHVPSERELLVYQYGRYDSRFPSYKAADPGESGPLVIVRSSTSLTTWTVGDTDVLVEDVRLYDGPLSADAIQELAK